jgi:hypothetical protein
VLASQVIELLVAEDGDAVPLAWNELPEGVAEDAARGLALWSSPVKVAAPAVLHCVHTIERRIGFPMPPVEVGCVRLPIGRNAWTRKDVAAAVRCLDTQEEPLASLEFPMGDVRPLAVLEAPPDSDADLVALANQLVGVILQVDVVPFVPCLVEVDGEEFEFVIGQEAVVMRLESVVEQMCVGRIKGMAGPLKDMPKLVRPGDVVEEMLWQVVLPELPVCKSTEVTSKDIDDWLGMAVDELEVNTESEFSSEEPLPEDVAMLFKRYRQRDRLDVSDD